MENCDGRNHEQKKHKKKKTKKETKPPQKNTETKSRSQVHGMHLA